MIEIKNLSVKFKDKVIYDNFNISFEENKITAILGKSGTGKTTLFNVLCGTISYTGEIVNNYPEKSMVYSSPRLIPTMTVEENLKFILKNDSYIDILKELNLYDSKDKYPDELSSGMAQRVSLIRAFLFNAKIVLMDEPTVNLDISLKYKLLNMFLSLWNKQKPTTLVISHSVRDAMYIADNIIIIDNNKIVLNIKNDKSDKTEKLIIDTITSL